MDKVRIGVIGIGNMGSAHVSCIGQHKVDGLELAGVCDINSQRLDYCKGLYPEILAVTDWKEFIQSPELDAVLIAVPHPLHADIAMAALKAGKNVLTEKPVDIRVSKAQELNECAKESGKLFGIMFNQRTDPLFQKAREIVRSGALGEMKRSIWIITNWFRTQAYYNSGGWRATWAGEGGGVLLNQCPHQLDLWQWICGMPNEVIAYCDIAKYHRIEVEDDVTIVTRYENGATGLFVATTGEYPGTNRLEITGSLGKIVLEAGKLKWWRLRTSEREVCFSSDMGSPKIETDYQEFTSEEPAPNHRGILQNFTNALLKGEPLLAPGYDGIYELTLSNAAYLSSWKNHEPVKIPMDTAAFDERLAELAAKSSQKEKFTPEDYRTTYNARWQVQW